MEGVYRFKWREWKIVEWYKARQWKKKNNYKINSNILKIIKLGVANTTRQEIVGVEVMKPMPFEVPTLTWKPGEEIPMEMNPADPNAVITREEDEK